MPVLYPIQLTTTPDAWRLFSMRKVDKKFADFSKKIFERDQYTCQFCGFQAMQYQEVVNLDQDYRNNKLSNLVTSCCFCTQCYFLESVGKDDYGGGVLIFMPELGQGELNGFCHVIFCAMANATSYRTDAQEIYRNLKLRSQIVEKNYGEGMSDPALLGRMLLDAPERGLAELKPTLLNNLRLLPSYSKFGKQIDDWARAAVEDLSHV